MGRLHSLCCDLNLKAILERFLVMFNVVLLPGDSCIPAAGKAFHISHYSLILSKNVLQISRSAL